MLRTVFPSIIRSSRLYTQHEVYVIEVSWLLASGHEMKISFHLVPASKQSTNLYDIYLMLYVQSWTPDDGRKDRPKHVERYLINSKIVHLVGFTTEIYDDARPHERQICPSISSSTTNLIRIGLESKPVLWGTSRWRTVQTMSRPGAAVCLDKILYTNQTPASE